MQVDISILNDRQLERKLARLVGKTQKKIVRQALRKEAKATKERVVANIQRRNLVDSGAMLKAFQGAKIRSRNQISKSRGKRGKGGFIRIGFENPERSQLGIRGDDKYYYPFAVEFGHDGVQAKPFIRPAVDGHASKSKRDIGRDIGQGIGREGRK